MPEAEPRNLCRDKDGDSSRDRSRVKKDLPGEGKSTLQQLPAPCQEKPGTQVRRAGQEQPVRVPVGPLQKPGTSGAEGHCVPGWRF